MTFSRSFDKVNKVAKRMPLVSFIEFAESINLTCHQLSGYKQHSSAEFPIPALKKFNGKSLAGAYYNKKEMQNWWLNYTPK